MLRPCSPLCWSLLIVVCAVTAWPAALVTAYRADVPPTLDGVLDDACWQRATVCGPFLSSEGGTLDAKTQALVAWDAGAVYVAFECFDRYLEPALQQTERVKAEYKEHDTSVFGDDCIEIFLDIPGTGLHQLAANSIGTRWEAKDGDVGWNGAWRVAAKRGTDRYIVECAIPLASLGVTDLAGRRWRANFCRERKAVEENSTWSGLQGAFNDRPQFGDLVFAATGPAVRTAALAPAAGGKWQFALDVLSPPADDLNCRLQFVRDNAAVAEQTLKLPVADGKAALSTEIALPAALAKESAFSCQWTVRSGSTDWAASPLLKQTVGLGQGQLTLQTAPGVQCHAFLDGKPLAGTMLELHSGLNMITLDATGGGWVRPEITLGPQKLPADARWFCTDQEPPAGWQTGATAAGFVPAKAVGKGLWAGPAGAKRVRFRRGLWVSPPGGRLFPGTDTLWLPAGTSQRVKPFLPCPAELPSAGYRMCLEVPSTLTYVAADGSEGAEPQAVTRTGSVYAAQYDRMPGRGLELSLRWGTENGTIAYQPGLQAGGTFDWSRLSGTFTAPADATILHPLVIKWQERGITGTFWVDNITVRRKGEQEDLLKVGDFEGPGWPEWFVKPGVGKDGTRGVKIVCLPERVTSQDAMWVPKDPVIEVTGGAEYVVEMDAKAENVVSDQYQPMASLLFKVAPQAKPGSDRMLVYFEAGGGNITEVARSIDLQILPPLLGLRPKHIRITPCYYSEYFSHPQVLAALADNFWRSGMLANYGGASNEVVRQLRQRGPHESILSLGYEPFAPPGKFRDLLKERPEVVALQYPDKPSTSRLCPTWLLNEAPEVMQALEDQMAEAVKGGLYQGADIDVEDPVVDPPTYCFCARCREAFRKQASLAADVVLTPQTLINEHRQAWTAFRCRQNAELVRHVRDGVKRGCPGIEFSVYSGTQSTYTQEHYGVDWKLMAPYIDLGIAGYNGPRQAIQDTIKALAPVPFMGGELYYLSNMSASGGAPDPRPWRNRLLRQCLESGAVGVLIWWLPVMDGGAFYYTSEAAAVLARYEEIFRQGQRCDGEVKIEGLPANDWLAYRRGNERLIILMNFKGEPVTPTITLPPGWQGAQVWDPVSAKKVADKAIPAFGVRVVTAKE